MTCVVPGPFVTVCTEVDATQERSHTGNHIVVVVMIVQVDLLLGCGSMVNDSVEMLSRYHMYLISYQESLKRFVYACFTFSRSFNFLMAICSGKRCDYVDTERFLNDKRCIIQIQNKDDMCCARAIVTAKAKIDEHEQWNSIQRGRRIQEELALELHIKAGVPL
jgi:hypothetical protein